MLFSSSPMSNINPCERFQGFVSKSPCNEGLSCSNAALYFLDITVVFLISWILGAQSKACLIEVLKQKTCSHVSPSTGVTSQAGLTTPQSANIS